MLLVSSRKPLVLLSDEIKTPLAAIPGFFFKFILFLFFYYFFPPLVALLLPGAPSHPAPSVCVNLTWKGGGIGWCSLGHLTDVDPPQACSLLCLSPLLVFFMVLS